MKESLKNYFFKKRTYNTTGKMILHIGIGNRGFILLPKLKEKEQGDKNRTKLFLTLNPYPRTIVKKNRKDRNKY